MEPEHAAALSEGKFSLPGVVVCVGLDEIVGRPGVGVPQHEDRFAGCELSAGVAGASSNIHHR
jgi:hypothetical protein